MKTMIAIAAMMVGCVGLCRMREDKRMRKQVRGVVPMKTNDVSILCPPKTIEAAPEAEQVNV